MIEDLDVICLSCGHEDMNHTDDNSYCRGSLDCDCTSTVAIVHSVAIGGLLERMKQLEKFLNVA